MTAVLVILVVGAAVLWFVAIPLLRSDAAEAELVSRKISEASELQSHNDMLVAALRDLEDDHATGKINEADYESMKSRLSVQAVDVMKKLDEAKKRHAEPMPKGPRAVPAEPTGPADEPA